MSKFEQCFLNNQIPKTGYQNQKLKWFSTDDSINYIKTSYNEDINYNFNSYGYRCEEFVEAEFKVLTLGCSIAFGNGIPDKSRFGSVFCQLLEKQINKKVFNYNLSWPGVSSDYVARIVTVVVPIIKPNVVLVNFPYLPRREYFDIDGNIFQFRPNKKPNSIKESKFISNFLALSSPYQDACNLFKNYILIDSICKQNNAVFLYSVSNSDQPTYQKVRHLFDESKKANSIDKIDFARDGGHPGIKTNENHAFNFLKAYNDLKSN